MIHFTFDGAGTWCAVRVDDGQITLLGAHAVRGQWNPLFHTVVWWVPVYGGQEPPAEDTAPAYRVSRYCPEWCPRELWIEANRRHSEAMGRVVADNPDAPDDWLSRMEEISRDGWEGWLFRRAAYGGAP